MTKSLRRFRFSLKSLFVLTTIAALLTGCFKYYYGYHAIPSEVELGSFHVLNRTSGTLYQCDCSVYLTTHWHDLLEQQTSAKKKKIQELVLLEIRATAYVDLCDPQLANLRNQIRNKINKEVGSVLGNKLVSEVAIHEFSLQKKPRPLFHRFQKPSLMTQATPSRLKNPGM